MNKNNPNQGGNLNVELAPEVAKGHYCNFAIISHNPSEFVIDHIFMMPNPQQAKVQTRVVMTPENAKSLLNALADNINRYEQTFGEIVPKTPKSPVGPDGMIPWPTTGGQA